MRRRIFVSYSHDDRAWRDAFAQMLGPALARYGVELWADDHIRSGDRWERVLDDALHTATLGLLLVTPAYLESSYSWEVEVPALVDGGVPIAWVLVEHCLWEDKALLRAIQGLQDPAHDGALADHHLDQKKELARICRRLRDEHLLTGRAQRQPADALDDAEADRRGEGSTHAQATRSDAPTFARDELLLRGTSKDPIRENLVTLGLEGLDERAVDGLLAALRALDSVRRPPSPPKPPVAGVASIKPGRRGQVFGAVPHQPSAFLARPQELERVRTQLLGGLQAAVGVAGTPSRFGLHGHGGIGKTVLAAELTRDPTTRGYFPDGIFWLTLGERVDVVSAQRQLASWLGGSAEGIRSAVQGAEVLRALAADKQCLVVLDDVWSLGAAQALAITGPRGRVLITARDRVLLERLGARTVSLNVLDDTEARSLLGQLTQTPPDRLPAAAKAILEATAGVALAVALVGAAIGRGGQRWADTATRLAESEEIFAGHPYADIFKALEVATAGLSAEERGRYQALACFPEDTVIPAVTIARLWGLSEAEAAVQLRRFVELKLLNQEPDGVTFHDLERDYLLLQAEATAAAHEQLLAAHRDLVDGEWYRLDPDDPYLWDHLAYHLAAAGLHHELVATVTDPAWLAVRIARDGTPAAERDLAEALRWEPEEPRVRAVLQRLQQASVLLTRAVLLHAVPSTLAIQLWPLRSSVNLTRLERLAFGQSLRWIADVTSPLIIRTDGGHGDGVISMAWTSDASLASVGEDGTLRIWDATTGTAAGLTVLLGPEGSARTVAWSSDGCRIASGSEDGAVRIWDLATGKQLRTLLGHEGAMDQMAWSPDGCRLASGGTDGVVRIWDLATGNELSTRPRPGRKLNRVSSLTWSVDGTQLASCDLGGDVRIWDAATGAELGVLIESRSMDSVAWSPEGTRIASGGTGGVWIWDAATGAKLWSLAADHLIGSLAWSPDGIKLASADVYGTMRIWDISTGTELLTLFSHGGLMPSLAWSPDGTRLASCSGGSVEIWDVVTRSKVLSAIEHRGSLRSLAWSPDGTRLATGDTDDTVRIWQGDTGVELLTLMSHGGVVRSLAWSPDGTRLASSGGGSVQIWDVVTGSELRATTGHRDLVASMAWSPDGTRVVSGEEDGTLRIFDADTAAQLHAFPAHKGSVSSLAWSPDGTQVASGGDDGTVRLWDHSTGAWLLTLPHGLVVWSLAWSPDGTLLASGGENPFVRIWHRTTGTIFRTFAGYSDVRSVAWSPDGRRLAWGGMVGTVQIGDVATGAPQFRAMVGSWVFGVDFSKDGALAIAANSSVIVLSPNVPMPTL